MPPVALNNILEAIFRSNPDYELVLFDRLPPEEQKALEGLQRDPDFYGLLWSRERTDLRVKSVCRDTALLYVTLNKPGKLPAYIRTLLGDQCNHAIAQLVLDGILEIESNGTFVSGPRAHRLIHEDRRPPEARSAIACRSIDALKYAQALNITDSQKLSFRLYAYGRQPASPHWKRTFPTRGALTDYLGIGGDIRSALAPNWLATAPEDNDPWLRWNSRDPRQMRSMSGFTYKLYVSPVPELVRDAFRATVKAIAELRATAFKVGGDVYGILRPDKMIVYFSSLEDLHEASNYLSQKLNGCSAHGVPFTAEIAGDGLLSWGVDPPRDQAAPEWQRPESWRLWVTNRLAVALLTATTRRSEGVEAWQFALDRLRLEGVDTQSWTPTAALWREDLSGKNDVS